MSMKLPDHSLHAHCPRCGAHVDSAADIHLRLLSCSCGWEAECATVYDVVCTGATDPDNCDQSRQYSGATRVVSSTRHSTWTGERPNYHRC